MKIGSAGTCVNSFLKKNRQLWLITASTLERRTLNLYDLTWGNYEIIMLASARPREIEIDKPSHTEQLANWISRVRCKKLLCRRNRKRNLRIEAVLTCALSKAEHELRSKQLSRISKWQQFKKQFLKTADYQNNEDMRNSNSYQENNPWQGPLCPELSSLDNFMSKLAEIKVPLQR